MGSALYRFRFANIRHLNIITNTSNSIMRCIIITKAMSDRSSSTKKMALQVIGGICSLIAELLSGVKSILTDPIPDVRSASALAILSLNESLGGGNENESNKDLDGISIKSKDVIQQDETSIISGRFIRKNVLG
eukprot:812967_1